MTFKEYQIQAQQFLKENLSNGQRLNLAALGLNGQSGEFADAWKKHIYHHKQFNKDQFILQLGDILWYLSLAAKPLGTSLQEIAQKNIQKLSTRYPERLKT